MKRRGLAPLLIVLIAASSLVATGGTMAGVRYYQSGELAKHGDEYFSRGEYESAAEAYQQAVRYWPRKHIKEQLDKAQALNVEAQTFNEGEIAYQQKSWAACIEKLQNVSSSFFAAGEASSKLAECRSNLEAEKTAEATPPVAKQSTNTTKKSAAEPKATTVPPATSSPSSSEDTSSSNSTDSNSSSSSSSCQSNTSPTFTSHMTDLGQVDSIVIPPRIISGHLKTHSYINSNHRRVPVYVPVSATLYAGVYLRHSDGALDYGLDFKASCEVTFRFGHITEPIQKIKDAFGSTPQDNSQTKSITPINFAAGELVAYTTGTNAAGNWDFGVYNSATKNRYADNPVWNTSSIYTTAVCPYDYFALSIKGSYSAKYITEFGSSILDGELFCN